MGATQRRPRHFGCGRPASGRRFTAVRSPRGLASRRVRVCRGRALRRSAFPAPLPWRPGVALTSASCAAP